MPAAEQQVVTKRVYDKPSVGDGFRILVDRLWPRGLTKEDAKVDLWLRDIAPSNELRKWFHANPEQWSEFRKRYAKELHQSPAAAAVDRLYEAVEDEGKVSLLFASKSVERNNATVLKEMVQGMKKPPRGTGPIRGARAVRRRAVR
ncbi:MAG TPA: DUF488 family protein [Terriglobales bacterium]